jgi:hypothetical protein
MGVYIWCAMNSSWVCALKFDLVIILIAFFCSLKILLMLVLDVHDKIIGQYIK